MANDRLFMECIECGERLTIAHYYPEGVCGWGPDDAIVKFLSRHVKCCPFSGQFTLRGHPLVRVLAESEEGRYHEDRNRRHLASCGKQYSTGAQTMTTQVDKDKERRDFQDWWRKHKDAFGQQLCRMPLLAKLFRNKK